MTFPSMWDRSTLGEHQARTRTIDPRQFPNEVFDLFSVPSYSNGKPDRALGSEIGSSKQLVHGGDVLLCKIVPHIRRAWVVPAQREYRQIASGEWIVLKGESLDPHFLQRFLLSDAFHEQFMRTVSGVGGSLMRARPSEAAKISVPVPPTSEQSRIVLKLNALFVRLDRARAELDRVPRLADHLRKQIVCSAFSGTLTSDWRALHTDCKPVDDNTLDQTYLAETGLQRKKPATEIDWRPPLCLPSSWRWVSVDRIVSEIQYGTSAKTSLDGGDIPVLRMGNIQRGRLHWNDLKYLPRDHDEFPNLLLRKGDALFNRTNSFELVGKTAAVVELDRPTSFASYLIRVHPFAMSAELFSYYLNSPYARRWIDRVASQQVGQANVNGSKLKALGIPLPPPEEQVEVLKRVNAAMAHADRLEAEASRSRALLDRLDAALLTKAFQGELVPQDPNDQPASALLSRVQGASASIARPKRSRRAGAR